LTLDIFFAFIIARLVVREMMVPEILLHDKYYIHFIAAQRIICVLAQGNTWAAVATNITYTICNLCNFYHNFGWNQNHNLYESLALAVVLLFGWIFQKWTYSEARATLEAKTLARSEATMLRLLSAMCDVVVQLGSDYLIRHPCPKLEALLLKMRTHSGLQGTSFMDLLDSSEQDRFDHFLSSEEDVACTFHIHMRDAMGTRVPV